MRLQQLIVVMIAATGGIVQASVHDWWWAFLGAWVLYSLALYLANRWAMAA